jgi:hypothetical protein
VDPKAKKTKLKLKRETVRTLDGGALNPLDGGASGTKSGGSTDPDLCGGHIYTDEQSICTELGYSSVPKVLCSKFEKWRANMEPTPVAESTDKPVSTDLPLDSVALARIMEEVRNNADQQPTAYNRMHNRHNR